MALHPDAIVDIIIEQLSFEGTKGVSWAHLWELLQQRVTAVNKESYQRMVYSWIKDNSKIVLVEGEESKPVQVPPPTLEEAAHFAIKVTEDHHWIALTGAPKHNNAIGARAFELLVAIAQSRSEGIDSMELIRATGQDNRSLTSRVKSIGHLVKKISILRNRRTLSLFTLNRFFDASKTEGIAYSSKNEHVTLNINELREKVVTSLKAAKNGIRQVNDLRRELEMDKTPRMKTVFKSVVTYLQTNEFIDKVLVVSPVSPTRKFRTLKYLKDFVPSDADEEQNGQEDDDDDDDEFNDDLVDDQLKDLDDDEPSSSLRSVVNLQVVATEENNAQAPLFNRFFPIPNQLYELVHANGTTGCSSTALADEIFGPSYGRLFSRWAELFTAGKFLPHIANYAIVRHYDFQGRVKFYRYLSRPNLLKFSGQPDDPDGSSLPEFKPSPGVTIEQMNKKYFGPLTSRAVVVEVQGVKKIIWHGSVTDLNPEMKRLFKESSPSVKITEMDPSIPKPKRGRPRKGEERPKTEIKKAKKEKAKVKAERAVPLPTAPVEAVESEKVVFADLKGHSFKSIERLSALLRIIEDSDGVREANHKLYLDLCEELGYTTDRKTFRKDIQSLIEQKKVTTDDIKVPAGRAKDSEDYFEQERTSVVTLLVSVHADPEYVTSVKEIMQTSRQSKGHTIVQLDEMSGVDMDFYDTELRVAFTNPSEIVAAKKPPRQRRLPPEITAAAKEATKRQVNKVTGQVKAKVAADPDATPDEIFGRVPTRAGAKRGRKKKTDSATTIKTSPELKIPKQGPGVKTKTTDNGTKRVKRAGRKRRVSQLNSEEMLLLFKAVIICKTINRNSIDWERISGFFETTTAADLKAKWPSIRGMMGISGISVGRSQWKKILTQAVQEGVVVIDDIVVENLEMLLKLWQDYQLLAAVEDTSEKLYVDVEQNYKEFGYRKMKTGPYGPPQYDYNSMVQREQFLVNKVFTYEEEKKDSTSSEVSKKETIRHLIIAILSSGDKFEIKKLSVLDPYSEVEINEVFVRMTRDKELIVNSSDGKVVLSDRLTGFLEDTRYDFSLEKIGKFQQLLKDLCSNNKGLVLDPVFDNSLMVPILELIKDQALNITRVDHYRKEVLSGYEARTLEREKLDCDIILDKPVESGEILGKPEKSVLVPSGMACSRVWIDIQGNINKDMWRKVVRVVLSMIISHPGITPESVHNEIDALLLRFELDEVVQWLVECGAVRVGEEEGLWVCPQWYMVLGLY